MHPELAIALYRHHEHALEVRLEHRRANLEKPTLRTARAHRRSLLHRHAETARR